MRQQLQDRLTAQSQLSSESERQRAHFHSELEVARNALDRAHSERTRLAYELATLKRQGADGRAA
jgi:hypothetical protein